MVIQCQSIKFIYYRDQRVEIEKDLPPIWYTKDIDNNESKENRFDFEYNFKPKEIKPIQDILSPNKNDFLYSFNPNLSDNYQYNEFGLSNNDNIIKPSTYRYDSPIQNNSLNNTFNSMNIKDNNLTKEELLAELDSPNNINVTSSLNMPVTMSPTSFIHNTSNNIEEKDIKFITSSIIENLDVAMLPIKQKMIKNKYIFINLV